MVRINSKCSIPDGEISFTFSRSSGPGGQNVNKLNTRVTLLFDVSQSPSLSEAQRESILGKLPTRISRKGILRVVSQKHRTQRANRVAAVERFAGLLREALTTNPLRKKTGIPRMVKQKRLEDKRQRSLLKTGRARPPETDD